MPHTLSERRGELRLTCVCLREPTGRRMLRRRCVLWLLLLGTCAPRQERWFDPLLAPCMTGAGAPTTIDAVFAHINTLPAPPSVACVIASLPRPLSLVATSNNTSAQPAAGPADPRVFVLTGDVIYAVVGAGRGSQLLELSERRGALASLKAELVFPLSSPVIAADGYAHLVYNSEVTTCGFCHRDEKRDGVEPGKVVSRALRPEASLIVSLRVLEDELARCDGAAPTDRCLLLAALVGIGSFAEGAFPVTWATFGAP